MPYSSLLMMVILSLQLLALYLIIFLHKQLLAIGLVVASLLLSAIIVILSRKRKQPDVMALASNSRLYDLITSLFSHINQRHYQLHTEFENLKSSLEDNEGFHESLAVELNKIRDLQGNLQTQISAESKQDNNHLSEQAVTSDFQAQSKELNQTKTEHLHQQLQWLGDFSEELAIIQNQLAHVDEQSESLRLMSLNLGIEAAKLNVPDSRFSQIATEVSQISRRTGLDNQQLVKQISAMLEHVENRQKMLRNSRLNKRSSTVTIDASNSVSASKQISRAAIETMSSLISNTNTLLMATKQFDSKLTKNIKQLNELDNSFRAVKEYFIECMIHLDELKQGLLTIEEYHECLERMSNMFAERYETDNSLPLVNDTLK